jgi:subtilase family serine protease
VNAASCAAITGEDTTKSQELATCHAKCAAKTDSGIPEDGLRDSRAEGLRPISDLQLDGPDLVLSSFTAQVSGSTVTFSATLCNYGAAPTSSFLVGVYYDETSAPNCSAYATDEKTVSSLGAGDCTTQTFTRSGAPSGTSKAWVMADSGCDILETSEANNTGSTSYTVGSSYADLAVSTFSASVSGTSVTYSATVCNNGASTSSTFSVNVYADRTSAPSCTSTAIGSSKSVYGLSSGSCTSLTFSRSSVASGSHTDYLLVDSSCSVTEDDESNNSKSTTYTVGSTGYPDLTVSSVTASVSGSTVTYSVTVCNNGASTTSEFYVGLFYDHSTDPGCSNWNDEKDFLGMSGGACQTTSFTRTGATTGTHTDWVQADDDCTLQESNESNNSKTVTYTVN